VCCASPATWAPAEPSPNEIKKQVSLELHGLFRLWLVLWRLARLLDFVWSPTGSSLKSIRRDALAMPIAACQNMELKSFINKKLYIQKGRDKVNGLKQRD
jgi:hypothetical protein